MTFVPESHVTEPTEPKSLKEMLFETVEGFEELEILIWFHEHGEGTAADAILLSRETTVSADIAETALAGLAARGILSSSAGQRDQFTYTPDAERRRAIDHVLSEYRENPLPVMKLMTANAIERVRTGAVRAFADSFRIKGPKSNG
jgi:hypothetical protein